MDLTRRSLLQLLGITIGAAAVIPAHTQHLVVEPIGDEPIEAEQPLTMSTRLEGFIRSHGIKPAHLARESGYSRQHLLRLRFGRMRPSLTGIASLVIATRRLTRERMTPQQLFESYLLRIACRDVRVNDLGDLERVEIRAAFGRRTLREFLGGQA